MPRIAHPDCRSDLHFADVKAGVAFKRLDDDIPLFLQLLVIRQVLKLAAPALFIDDAGRFDAVFRAFAHFFDPAFGKFRMNLCRLDDDFLARQGAGDEYDLFLKIAHAFAVDAEAFDRQRKLLPDF